MAKPFIVGITGGSGSGKTSFLNELRSSFSEKEVAIISQDDYYHPREDQIYDKNGIQNFDLPSSIDHIAFENDIKTLIRGEKVERIEYVFNNEKAEPSTKTTYAAPIIVVEGIFIYFLEEIRKLIDLKLYIHAGKKQKLKRRIKRDFEERNYPEDDVRYRYKHHVAPTFKTYIKPYKQSVNIVINNNEEGFDEALNVVKTYIKSKL